MKDQHRHYLSISIGLLVLGFLIFATWANPPTFENLLVGLMFGFLVVFTTTFGVPLAGGTVSMLPTTTIAAFLILDLIPGGWVAYFGAIFHGWIRQHFSSQLGIPKSASKTVAIAVPMANASIQATSILAGGWVYKRLGGAVPLVDLSLQDILSLAALAILYLGANLSLIAVYMAARGREALKMYVRSLPNLLLYEASPLIFVPLMVLIYTRLGYGLFILFALAVILASLITRRLAVTSTRLERRVQELDSLQTVGQSLSANLRLSDLLPVIYEQVDRLMNVDNFYVALYYPDEDEVTFPLAIEENQPVEWRSRRAGNGLTEYVLRAREPLLIPSDVGGKLAELGIEQIGQLATSWLGVPILTGEEPLGAMVVQSYTAAELYDESHREILVTIAAQAGIAIQNARLYEQTDEALAHRVQELNSILRTSAEGLLLLSIDWRVLAANRSLARFLGVAETELSGGDWGTRQLLREPDLLEAMGFSVEALKSDCQELTTGEIGEKRVELHLSGPPERYLERTLTPVLDRGDEIVGWLLVFRDITEEIALARLREDMTHMLVHDLRSPLTALKGSLWLLRQIHSEESADDQTGHMLDMAERNTARMIDMVTSLLDIAKLENGQMPLLTETVVVEEVFEEVSSRVTQLAEMADIALEASIEPGLPDLKVDLEHTRRVIVNLLDNAIKFTPDGGRVRLWAKVDENTYPARVLIGVSDTGPGISEKAQEKLFQKFQQDSTAEGRRRGTGLGLAYCKLVVEAHGGEIWVESQEGQGSNFIVRLPAAR